MDFEDFLLISGQNSQAADFYRKPPGHPLSPENYLETLYKAVPLQCYIWDP